MSAVDSFEQTLRVVEDVLAALQHVQAEAIIIGDMAHLRALCEGYRLGPELESILVGNPPRVT